MTSHEEIQGHSLSPLKVELFGHEQCCLCREAEDLLDELRREYSFTLEKIDIRSNNLLNERWRCSIPVVLINGGNQVALRITTERLRRAFERALQRATSESSSKANRVLK